MILAKGNKELRWAKSAEAEPHLNRQWVQNLHGGQGDQRGEGPGHDGGDPVVIEGQQPHGAQASKGVVAHTAD